jgi:hypothetical protein
MLFVDQRFQAVGGFALLFRILGLFDFGFQSLKEWFETGFLINIMDSIRFSSIRSTMFSSQVSCASVQVRHLGYSIKNLCWPCSTKNAILRYHRLRGHMGLRLWCWLEFWFIDRRMRSKRSGCCRNVSRCFRRTLHGPLTSKPCWKMAPGWHRHLDKPSCASLQYLRTRGVYITCCTDAILGWFRGLRGSNAGSWKALCWSVNAGHHLVSSVREHLAAADISSKPDRVLNQINTLPAHLVNFTSLVRWFVSGFHRLPRCRALLFRFWFSGFGAQTSAGRRHSGTWAQ